MKARIVLAACLLVGLLCGGAAGAQGAPARTLSLGDFLQVVVQSNPAVREARLQWLISAGQARAQWGTFEPTIVGSYKVNGLVQQNTALQKFQQLGTQLYDESNNDYSLAIEGNLPTGGNYNVGASMSRLQDTYVEAGQYRSFVGVSALQPLLKGLTHGAPLAAVRTALQDRIIAFHEYRRELMTTIAQAESAYWNLAFAQEAARMNADSVEVARKLLQAAQEGARVGTLSDLDLRQAEAELATRSAAQEDGEVSVTEARTQLELLMGGGEHGGTVLAGDPLLAETTGEWNAEEERADLLAWAERAQPDYMIESQQLERESIQVGYQSDQALPQLNVSGSYGYTGLGDTPQSSLDSLQGQAYPTWSVGIELRLPTLLGVKARDDLEVEKLKQELAAVRVQTVRDQMSRTITSLVESVGTLRAHVDNQRTITESKSHLLDVEMARLDQGTNSLLDVYKAEDGLRQARQQELEAVVRYRQAVMDLARISGSILRDQGLEMLVNGQVELREDLRVH